MATRTKAKTNDDEPEFVLSEYKDNYVDCRVLGHSWKRRWQSPPEETSNVAVMILGCRSCRTKRIDTLSRVTGMVLERKYEYPDDYRHHHRTARVEYRIELIARALT